MCSSSAPRTINDIATLALMRPADLDQLIYIPLPDERLAMRILKARKSSRAAPDVESRPLAR